jgi:hypothetical protein
MRLKITIALAALALGTAFASVSALAAEQKAAPYYGRNANDGGMGPVQPAAKPARPARPLYDSVQPPSTPHYGRAVDDGGMVNEPSAAAIADAKARNKLTEQKQTPHTGRPINDGGTM